MPTLDWIGKERILTHHLDVPFRVLTHIYGFNAEDTRNRSETGSGNMVIHGDNLEALKALLPRYEGAISCVYIDPPYNTGKEGWSYNDNVNDPRMQRWLQEALNGATVGPEGEDLTRHDKWACVMYPRLKLISQLLKDDGALAISIGYHELHTLIYLCRAIFPNKQIVPITVQTSGGKPSGGFNYLHEYVVFVVAKDFVPNILDFCGGVPRRPFEGLTLSTFSKVERPNQTYPIFINPQTECIVGVGDSLAELIEKGLYFGTKEDFEYDYSIAPEGTVAVWPVTSKGKECVWRQISSRVLSDWKKGYIKVVKNTQSKNSNLFSVQYLPEGLIKKIKKGILEIVGHEEGKPTLVFGENQTEGSSIPTIWLEKDFYTVKGTNSLKQILPEVEKKFDYPKSPDFIYSVLQAISKDGDIVLDSFAGSGTTAQALLRLNEEDGGERHFILVEMMDYADEITAERIKRVMKGYSFEGEEKEVIYSKKLTPKNILNAQQILMEAEGIAKERESEFTRIGKPKIVDNCLTVIGTRVIEGRKEGLGGAFDYYELGEPLFNEDGNLNEHVDINSIRAYIYYSETKTPLTRKPLPGSYLLDTFNGTGYYFYYERSKYTVLSMTTRDIVTERADNYIIYADACTLPEAYMRQHNIIFKKIPRDIKQF